MRITLVIGGGIAGLSVAWQLAAGGDRQVRVLEREAFFGTHSSARNAQIWLPADDDETTGPLAARSLALLNALLGSERAWLHRSPAVVIAPDEHAAQSVERGAEKGALSAHRVTDDELATLTPMLRPTGEPSLRIDGAGIFDPNAMLRALERACRAASVELCTGRGVARVVVREGRARGVELEDGSAMEADEVVIAGGAWARALGRSAGVDVPLVPLRRHLIVLEGDARRAGTTVWRFGREQVYYRPESGGVLASPCDEQPFDPCLPPSDARALEALAAAIEPIAPELVDAGVRTSWACLRTYAHDRELVLGPDPRLEGLAWMAGFGGRGMTVGVGAGELCAAAMRGDRSALLEAMRPDRAQPEALSDPSS